MKSSRFATAALMVGLLVLVAAMIGLFASSETGPLASVLFLITFVTYLPEYPLAHLLNQMGMERMSFPVVLPLLSIVCALVSFRRKEDKRLLSGLGVALVLISILLYLLFP